MPRNPRTSFSVCGNASAWIARTFLGDGLIPSPSTTCPRKSILEMRNRDFDSFMVMFASLNLCKTSTNRSMCSSTVCENVQQSSIYTITLCQVSPPSTVFISRWKFDDAFISPNGCVLNSNCPSGVMKLVFSLSASSSSCCQNPELASIWEKYLDPANAAKVSSILGIGIASNLVSLLSSLKSMQNLWLPSGLATRTGLAPHGLRLGLITPSFSIFATSARITSLSFGANRYGCSRIGCALPVSILAFNQSTRPIFSGSRYSKYGSKAATNLSFSLSSSLLNSSPVLSLIICRRTVRLFSTLFASSVCKRPISMPSIISGHCPSFRISQTCSGSSSTSRTILFPCSVSVSLQK